MTTLSVLNGAPSRLTPLKSIRAKCLDCCCGVAQEVRKCTTTTCSLHPYRLGKRPATVAKAEALKAAHHAD